MARLDSTRRTSGFSLAETLLAAALLGSGVLALGAFHAGLVGSEGDDQRRHAVQIARDQLDVADLLPWGALQPTDGFRSAAWIELPGRTRGELPVRVDGEEHIYTVNWKVEAIGAEGNDRKIHVRVHWQDDDGLQSLDLSRERTRKGDA